jgi:hypothetical protein
VIGKARINPYRIEVCFANPGFAVHWPGMRFLESCRVPLFEGLLPSLQPACWRRISKLIGWFLLLEILLSYHVQLGACWQLCVARRLLSRLLPDFVRRLFLRGSTMLPAMSKEHRHAANNERC